MEVKAQMGKPTRKLTSASKRVCLVALEGDFFLPSLRLQLQENQRRCPASTRAEAAARTPTQPRRLPQGPGPSAILRMRVSLRTRPYAHFPSHLHMRGTWRRGCQPANWQSPQPIAAHGVLMHAPHILYQSGSGNRPARSRNSQSPGGDMRPYPLSQSK